MNDMMTESVRGTFYPFHTLSSDEQDNALKYLARRFVQAEPVFGAIISTIAQEELRKMDHGGDEDQTFFYDFSSGKKEVVKKSPKERHDAAFARASAIVEGDFMKYLSEIKNALIEQKLTFVFIDTHDNKRIRGVIVSDIISKENLHGVSVDVGNNSLRTLVDFLDKLDEPLEKWIGESNDKYVRIKFGAAEDSLIFDFVLHYAIDAYRVCKHNFRGFIAEVTHPVSQAIAVTKKNVHLLKVVKYEDEGIFVPHNRETGLSVFTKLKKNADICMFEKIRKGGPGAALIVKMYDDDVSLEDYSLEANRGIDILDIETSVLDIFDTKVLDESGKSDAEHAIDFVVKNFIEREPMFKTLRTLYPPSEYGDPVARELKEFLMSRIGVYTSSGVSFVGRLKGEFVFVSLNSLLKARDVRVTNDAIKKYDYIRPALKVLQKLWSPSGFTSSQGLFMKIEFLAVKNRSLAAFLLADYLCVNSASSLRTEIAGMVAEATHIYSLYAALGVCDSFVFDHVSYSDFEEFKTIPDPKEARGLKLSQRVQRSVHLATQKGSAVSVVFNLDRAIGHF